MDGKLSVNFLFFFWLDPSTQPQIIQAHVSHSLVRAVCLLSWIHNKLSQVDEYFHSWPARKAIMYCMQKLQNERGTCCGLN